MRGVSSSILLSLGILAFELFSTPARAGIEACGNINVEASAKCEAKAGVKCTAQCKPVSFKLACEAQVSFEGCEGECKDLPDLECSASCSGECQAECEVEPAEFSCEGSCTGTCEGDCSGKCEAESNHAACEARCKGVCKGECGASCEGQPATVDCEGKCNASCEGSCSGDLTFDCEIECKGEAELECESELKGGCEADCKTEEGALFCDGQYVDHGGNLDECIDALNKILKVKVEASASGECAGNECKGEAAASCKCEAPGSARSRTSGVSSILFALGAFGLTAARRRRSKAS